MWDHCWNARRTNQKSLWQAAWLGLRSGCLWEGQRDHRWGWVQGLVWHLDWLQALYWWPRSGGWSGSRDAAIVLEGRGARGLQLLATTVSSSMSLSLSVSIWKWLLCCVRCWCTIGNQQIVHGVMMVFDVVATLGGVAIATLRGGSVSTLRDVGKGGGKLGWLDLIVESW
jgi:hypothetical protein